MKTIQHPLPIRNLHEDLALVAFMIVMFIMSFFQDASAQAVDRFQNDPYFPARHKFNAGFITTYRGSSIAAPVAIGEVNYGVSRRFSVGILGGTTGTLAVIGVRLAGNLYQKENFRLLGRMSVIFYPERNGTFMFDKTNQHVMPWILSTGLLDGEWRMKNGLRWSLGMGLIETHCLDGMMDLILGRTPSAEEEEGELPFELFNTVQGSVSIPLSKRFTIRPETIFVLQGSQLIKGENHKMAPVLMYLNLVYTF